MNFYNDNDPKACAWLRELIADGHIPPGTVDDRSILEIKPADLAGFDQCHFFAGVAFWSLALQWAGLGDRPGIWTGSCPCQPWSCAGAGKGHADERHLWPAFRDLILACRPAVVFGEQVASAAVVGKVGRGVETPAIPVWLDGVRNDMEEAGYAFGAAVLGAHSVGAPHIRQRCYWVADALGGGCAAWRASEPGQAGGLAQPEQRGGACRASDAELPDRRAEQQPGEPGRGRGGLGGDSESGRTPLAPRGGQRADGGAPGQPGHAEQLQQAGGACDSDVLQRKQSARSGPRPDSANGERACCESTGSATPGGAAVPWGEYRVHRYLDGKDRRIPAEPIFQLLSDGCSAIMGMCWNKCLLQIKAEVMRHECCGQELRALWGAVAAETVQRESGVPKEISSPEILLFALCELAGHKEFDVESATSDLAEMQTTTVRIVREAARKFTAAPRTSHQRRLAGSQAGELANPVHSLPLGESAQKTEETNENVCALCKPVTPKRDVPASLPAVEEIWRSFFDETEKAGDGERLRTCASTIDAMCGFPLAGTVPGRVMLLRGFGNGILPALAAEFIGAWLDVSIREDVLK